MRAHQHRKPQIMRSPFQSYDRLKESGMSDAQARSIVEAIEESADFSFKDLATKSDLLATKSELRTEIAELRTELKGDIAQLDTKFTGLHAATQATLHSMQKVIYGGFTIMLAAMIGTYFHH